MDRFRLECFVALAEELNFHRAAARCHITQPAMSQQIRMLEEQLDVRVANRNTRSVSLTRAGALFLVEARKLLKQMDSAVTIAQRAARGEIGQLNIGVTSPALYLVFPEIVRQFRRDLPDVGLLVHEMHTAEQEHSLREGEIQVGIVHPPLDDVALSCRVISRTEFSLVLPDYHPLAQKREIGLADLTKENFIMFPRKIAPSLYDTIITLCQGAGFSPSVILETHPAQSIIGLVAAGFGVGFIASPLQQFQRPGVVFRKIAGAKPYLTLGVAVRLEDTAPATLAFVRAAGQVSRSLR